METTIGPYVLRREGDIIEVTRDGQLCSRTELRGNGFTVHIGDQPGPSARQVAEALARMDAEEAADPEPEVTDGDDERGRDPDSDS